MKNSLPEQPLKQVLGLIPYTDTIVDPELLDKIGLVLIRNDVTPYCASVVLSLLLFLAENGLVELQMFTWPSALGNLYIIKRKLNG